jgi:DNA-binding transcriptional LysR family regulator
MLKLDSIAAFVAVADATSITEASRRLGLAKSVVSERLTELERTLGTRLVQRTTRKLSLTEDGAAFLIRARRIVTETSAATAELAERRGALLGPLRISAPVTFGSLHLGRVLCDFVAEHPQVDLTLDLDDRFVDIAADGYDAVVRHGPVPDQRAVVKRLAASRRLLVAAPAYLKQHAPPRGLHELAAHRGILYSHREPDWCFRAAGKVTVVRPKRSMRLNNGLLMRDAALAGLGITLLPEFAVYREIASGALLKLDLGVEPEGADIFLAYDADRGSSAKLRALTAWLRGAFAAPQHWQLPATRRKHERG